jgi:hypothetical protein
MKYNNISLVTEYNAEFCRTTGKKQGNGEYANGWFTIHGYRKEKLRGTEMLVKIAELKKLPTAVARFEMVNGVSTWIEADQHVVQSVVGGKDVIEAKDTPYGCSVSDEAYWSN